jgi:hypothetical protein
MEEEELKIKIRMILSDYERRDDYSLHNAELDMFNLLDTKSDLDQDVKDQIIEKQDELIKTLKEMDSICDVDTESVRYEKLVTKQYQLESELQKLRIK